MRLSLIVGKNIAPSFGVNLILAKPSVSARKYNELLLGPGFFAALARKE